MVQSVYFETNVMAALPPQIYKSKRRKRTPMSNTNKSIRVTWSSVEVQSHLLLCDDFELAVAAMVKAIDMAATQDREEFLVIDIAPGEPVGSAKISEIQGRLEKVISEGFSRVGRQTPETRLSLRGSEYDLRLYIGRSRPTDFRFE